MYGNQCISTTGANQVCMEKLCIRRRMGENQMLKHMKRFGCLAYLMNKGEQRKNSIPKLLKVY